MKKSEKKQERILGRRLAKHMTAEDLRQVSGSATAFSFCFPFRIDDVIS